MVVSNAKAIPRWPAAMATSLGLHLAALLFATSEAPRRPSDPMIEIEVLPVRVEVPQPIRTSELADSARRGAEVAAKRRSPIMSRLAASRLARSTAKSDHAESKTTENALSSTASGSASAESVTVAKATLSEGVGTTPVSVVAAQRVGVPKTVAAAVGDGLLAINPNDVDYQPRIPPSLSKPGASFLSLLKFCVAENGSVDRVTVVTSSEPAINNAILEKARLYRFHPYFDQGRPIPFCFYRKYHLSIHE